MRKAKKKSGEVPVRTDEIRSGFLLSVGTNGISKRELGAFRKAVDRALGLSEQGFTVVIEVLCFHIGDPYANVIRASRPVMRELGKLTPSIIRLEFAEP